MTARLVRGQVGRGMMFSVGLMVTMFLFTACGPSRPRVRPDMNHYKMFSGAPAPDKVYEAPYYKYKNGRYTFVKGHYRTVISRKKFYSRTLRGYGSKGDYTAAR